VGSGERRRRDPGPATRRRERFASVVQLLETRGERLVRISYTTGGAVRRGPVTLRARDLERLRAELDKHTELAAALGLRQGVRLEGGA
jgi:hypothetical protein